MILISIWWQPKSNNKSLTLKVIKVITMTKILSRIAQLLVFNKIYKNKGSNIKKCHQKMILIIIR